MRTKSVRTKRNLPWKELHAVSQEAHNFLKHNQAAIFSSKSFQSGCTVQTSKIQGLRPQLGSNQDPRNPVSHWFLVIAKYNLAFKSFLLELQTNIFFFFSFWTLKNFCDCFPAFHLGGIPKSSADVSRKAILRQSGPKIGCSWVSQLATFLPTAALRATGLMATCHWKQGPHHLSRPEGYSDGVHQIYLEKCVIWTNIFGNLDLSNV